MDPKAPPTAAQPSHLTAWAGDLLAAIGLLTVLPLPRPDPRSPAAARATLYFPVAGGLVGISLVGFDLLVAPHLPNWLASLLVVAAWEILGRPPIERPAGRVGPAVNAVIKLVALAKAGAGRSAALLFAPMLGAWSIVVLAVGARNAATPARKFNGAVAFREFALTSVLSAGIIFTLAQAAGIIVFVGAAAVVLGLRLLFHRWPGGVSWPLLRLSGASIESLVVVLFALF